MKLRIIAVGKLRDPGLRALADDYKRRIARHVVIEEQEVRDDAALKKALPDDYRLVALEVDGREYTSIEFAATLRTWGETAPAKLAFMIGGAEGIPEAVSRAAHYRLSLSRMTMPHRIARVLLFEQLYRATSIWRGEPYARED
jgi:23S rRNA (pseudouridine1915-N3)-methyltransferase